MMYSEYLQVIAEVNGRVDLSIPIKQVKEANLSSRQKHIHATFLLSLYSMELLIFLHL